jgi:hypothetical protein
LAVVAIAIIFGLQWATLNATTYQSAPFASSGFAAVPERGECYSSPNDLHLWLEPIEIRRYEDGRTSVLLRAHGEFDPNHSQWNDTQEGGSDVFVLKGLEPALVTFTVHDGLDDSATLGYCSVTISHREE